MPVRKFIQPPAPKLVEPIVAVPVSRRPRHTARYDPNHGRVIPFRDPEPTALARAYTSLWFDLSSLAILCLLLGLAIFA